MSRLASLFELGSRYSFQLTGGAILPLNIKNVKVTSILNGRTAERLGYNVATKHEMLYPLLDQTRFTRNFLDQEYVEVEYDNGQTDCFAESWIVEGTIQRLTKQRYVIVIKDIEPSMITPLQECLNANGFNIDKILPETEYLSR